MTETVDARSGRRRVAALYSQVAQAYAAAGPPFFAYAGRRLVELAGVAPGDRVIDLATGRGAALFPAAERVGPSGHIVGIDLAPGMVVETAASISERNIENAVVLQMDAAALGFAPSSVDRVLCSFAVFFFPDLPRVLAEALRVLRPGGTLGFAFSRGTDARWQWFEARLQELGAFEGSAPPPGDRTIRQKGRLAAALTSAGASEARELLEEAELFFPNENAWWELLWTHGSRVPLDRIREKAPDVLAHFREECLERVVALKTPRGVPERHTFVYVTARR